MMVTYLGETGPVLKSQYMKLNYKTGTQSNRSLLIAGDNDQIRVIRFRVIEGPNTRDQSAFSAFHSFLVEVQMIAGYIHTTHA